MPHPTFEEAARHWPRLNGGDESAHQDELYQACEEVILRREISSPEDALIVCQVLLDNLKSGERSDGLDVQALASLRNWLGHIAGGPGLTGRALFRGAAR
ncbi:MAG: hypothetical protein ACI8U3_001229 [Brevundimonas sp.]|jgi:hypothetical protein|uniref:hypothetical protein n=1 Tax=Brevundimonas sp. TaxID=1871086 RepID=UPI0039E41AD4